jgi:chemotaxis protein methyltransferase WspC
MTHDQAEIEALLARRIGLDPVAVGPHLIARAVRQRMRELGLNDPGEYQARVGQSETELQALIEEVVVPESWFFRDERPFQWLGQYVRARWLADPARSPLRVLSVPCAGGEEPYSIAITLLDLGLPARRFHIDAVDVSARRLTAACRGVYSRNAFRGSAVHRVMSHQDSEETLPGERRSDPVRRKSRPPESESCPAGVQDSRLGGPARYFHDHPQGYEVDAAVREPVQFIRASVLDPNLLEGSPPYDVIFCRNLLIYLNAPARTSVLAVIDRLLSPDGVLFIGHADRLDLAGGPPRFTPVSQPGCFAYLKAVRTSDAMAQPLEAKPPQPVSSKIKSPVIVTRRERLDGAPSPTGATDRAAVGGPPLAAIPLAQQQPSLLEQAAELANRGRHAEAIATCQRHLQLKGPGAPAYFLMGMIAQATGDVQRAEDCFHKTVYLDPKHDEALLALALLAQRRGDHNAAAGFHRRAERTRARNRTQPHGDNR